MYGYIVCFLMKERDLRPLWGRRAAVREVQVRGGGHFWGGLAATLGCAPSDLIYWGKVRRAGISLRALPCTRLKLSLWPLSSTSLPPCQKKQQPGYDAGLRTQPASLLGHGPLPRRQI